MVEHIKCEALVVGAGVGGCITAHELVVQGLDVLLIDSGPFVPVEHAPIDKHLAIQQLWQHAGLTSAFGRPPLSYAEARCVGGGSEINSGILQRCPDHLLSEWSEEFKITDFSLRHLTAYYDQAECMVNADYPQLKQDSLVLKNAAQALNWQGIALKTAYKNCQKQSLSKVLITQLFNYPNFKLKPNCRLLQFFIKNKSANKAIIQTISQNNLVQEVHFKYLFLCAGAIQTPFLLLKNKIKQNIGNTLKVHPSVKILAQFKYPLQEDQSVVPNYAITEFMPNIRIGGSVFSPTYFGMSLAEDWENRKHLLPYLFYCGMYYAMIRPEGSGKIRYIPSVQDPIVTYRLTKKDWALLHVGLQQLIQVMFVAKAHFVVPSIVGHHGFHACDSKKIIDRLVPKSTTLMSVHLFGSCPMGENPEKCAANSYGQLHEFDNIFINDASLIPDATGTNPQNTIMAIALRNMAYFINQVHRV